jgi:hypothetical protein
MRFYSRLHKYGWIGRLARLVHACMRLILIESISTATTAASPYAFNSILFRAPLGIGSRYLVPIGPIFCRRIEGNPAIGFLPGPKRPNYTNKRGSLKLLPLITPNK